MIQLKGPLFSAGTDYLIHKLKQAENNPKIQGVILEIDGPGGQGTRVDVAAKLIREFSKPVATVVTGAMCSAHFWFGIAAKRVFAESRLSVVGSVGVFQEYVSFKEYYKAQGVDTRDIYPDSSDLKNAEVRAIEERNDESIMKAQLAQMHKIFCEDVAEALSIPYDPAAEIFRGRVYGVEDALKAGYIDQMGDVEDACRWIVAQNLLHKLPAEIMN